MSDQGADRRHAGELEELLQREIREIFNIPEDCLQNKIVAAGNGGAGNDLRDAYNRGQELLAVGFCALIGRH